MTRLLTAALAAVLTLPAANSEASRVSIHTAVRSLAWTWRAPSGSMIITPPSARHTGAPS